MMQEPWGPLVTATGLPRNSGKSRCSMDAKNAFMSTWRMARDQGSTMAAGFRDQILYIHTVVAFPCQIRGKTLGFCGQDHGAGAGRALGWRLVNPGVDP